MCCFRERRFAGVQDRGLVASAVVLGSGKSRAVKGLVGRRLADRLSVGLLSAGLTDRLLVGERIGSTGGRQIGPRWRCVRLAKSGRGLGSVSHRRIGPPVMVALIGLAAGIGVAVGVEVRSAVHRSAGATPGFRIDVQ